METEKNIFLTLVKIKDNTLTNDKYYIALFEEYTLIMLIEIDYNKFVILKNYINDYIELEA